ncbi:Lhr family helicase, partial [Cryobacterium algoricola]|uniref:Lhr family helicase n=1 Tax=Cryobacterium algoricola TaxID=1259183 RepID=UPI003B97B08E
SGGRTAHSTRRAAPRARLHGGRGLGRATMPLRGGPPTVSGRWSIVPVADDSPTRRAHALGETLLERYGVVTRGAVVGEGVTGGFALVYRTLSGFEESGRCRRGYFIDGLGAAQFATAGTIDRLRSFTESEAGRNGGAGSGSADAGPVVVTLAATDPANPYGAVLPWPALPTGTTHRAARKAGAIVVLVDGALVLYVERGGKTVLAFDGSRAVAAPDPAGLVASGADTDGAEPAGRAPAGAGAGAVVDADVAAARDALFTAAARALAATVTSGRIAKLGVETVNGAFVIGTPFGRALQAAGFGVTPKGLKLHA